MAKKVLNITLAVTVDTNLRSVTKMMDALETSVDSTCGNVEVVDTEVVDYFEVYV